MPVRQMVFALGSLIASTTTWLCFRLMRIKMNGNGIKHGSCGTSKGLSCILATKSSFSVTNHTSVRPCKPQSRLRPCTFEMLKYAKCAVTQRKRPHQQRTPSRSRSAKCLTNGGTFGCVHGQQYPHAIDINGSPHHGTSAPTPEKVHAEKKHVNCILWH
jgi:hypothetical protein